MKKIINDHQSLNFEENIYDFYRPKKGHFFRFIFKLNNKNRALKISRKYKSNL